MKPAVPWHLSADEADELLDAMEVLRDAATMREWPPRDVPSDPLEWVREQIASESVSLEWLATTPGARTISPGFVTPEEERFGRLWRLDELRAKERWYLEDASHEQPQQP
jgi:hypothetical protein